MNQLINEWTNECMNEQMKKFMYFQDDLLIWFSFHATGSKWITTKFPLFHSRKPRYIFRCILESLEKRVCPSLRLLVCPSVGDTFVKNEKKNDVDGGAKK